MKQILITLSEENDHYLRQLALAEKKVYGSLAIVLNRILDGERKKHGAKR